MSFDEARVEMAGRIRAEANVSSERVLAAMTAVPREFFVSRFWAAGQPHGALRQWDVLADPVDDIAPLVYDINSALSLYPPSNTGTMTSTASAPRLMAYMLDLLNLEPGMRVLEIGTGSGYNAALLAQIVGPDAVTTVDIDAELVDQARERLDAFGLGEVLCVSRDGYEGATERAPYDRVVATVGCIDLAPAWLAQLAPGGYAIVPLQHGGVHPLIRAVPDGAGALGQVVGRAGFVAILGRQAARSIWSHAGRLGTTAGVEWEDLPAELSEVLELGADRFGGRRLWDFGYYVALEDRRAAQPGSLRSSDGSSAAIDAVRRRIGHVGATGLELRDRLIELADAWLALGRPPARDFQSRFLRLDDRSTTAPKDQWIVDRVDYRQSLTI